MSTHATEPADPFGTARLRGAVLDAWTASPARFREDANTEEDLARGGYRDRLIIELAQNAADAAARAGTPGRLRLALEDGRLVVANTGAALDAAGVESLSTLRASAKRPTAPAEAGSVGRFGVGFAAALTVSDAPAVVSRSGGVRWSLDEATALTRQAAEHNADLAAELDRRHGARHGVPLLRLPLPATDATDGAPPAGYDTAVLLPLRDAAAADLAARLLAGIDDTLLLVLPALTEVTVATPDGTRALSRRQNGPYTVVAEGERTTRWRTATARGVADAELLADRPLEERERPSWSVTWAVPAGPGGGPAPPPAERVVHAPTPTDDPLDLPALLIASFPLDPTRRRVAPGPLTDFLLQRAADAYAELLADWEPVTVGTLDLVPGPLGPGELDTALRALLRERLPRVPFLPPAAIDTAPEGVALTPERAELVEDAGAATVAALAELFPALLPAGLEHRAALRVLGVPRVPLSEVIDRAAGADRPPQWWRRLYDSLGGVDPERLSGLPVPLADGRVTLGPRQVLLPDAGTDPAHLARLGLPVAHPEAAHPLLEKLGARPATPRAVLDTPQVRQAVAASLDADLGALAVLGGGASWDVGEGEEADGDAAVGPPGPEELAELVLSLVREAGLGPEDEPWLADLALPDEDGELAAAGDLVYPGSAFQQVIAEGELAAVGEELAERWGEQPLTAVGVQADFALVRASDVVLDPDELYPEEVEQLDAVDVWCEDTLDALPGGTLPPVATELLAVRDLELVDDDQWPRALAMLSRPPLREALTEPVRVRRAEGGSATVRPYTAWWLRGAPVLGGRPPAGLRAAGGDPLLAGLYEEADTAEADEGVLRALGVRTTAVALLAEPGGAAELLARLGDPDLPVGAAQLHGLYTLLAALPPEDVTLPDALRAVVDGVPRVVPAAQTAVADAPDLLPLTAGRALLPVAPVRAAALATVLDVPLLSAEVAAPPPEGGTRREVPAAVRALLGPQAPATYVEHDELSVGEVALDWRVAEGTAHATTLEGLAAALAWAAGHWPRRFELAALLEDPTRTEELATARWFE